MYILNIASATKKMTVNEFTDYYKRVGLNEKHLLFMETSEKSIYYHMQPN